jgi:hypothetical protein
VPSRRPIERLTDVRHVTVILRLVLKRGGQLTRGEIVDVDGTTRIHFMTWRELTRALRAWLIARYAPKTFDP